MDRLDRVGSGPLDLGLMGSIETLDLLDCAFGALREGEYLLRFLVGHLAFCERLAEALVLLVNDVGLSTVLALFRLRPLAVGGGRVASGVVVVLH